MFRTQPSGGVWAGSHPLTTSWFTFGTTLLCSSSHCTVWHSFARPLSSYCILEFTLQCLGHCTLHCSALSCPASPWADCPLARCPQGRSPPTSPRFNLSVTKIVRMLARALLRLKDRFLDPLVPQITIGIVPSPFFLSSSASSVHEPRRHIVGPSEQHVGVVPARLGLVREPLCVVESFQRGVDVVIVPTRGVSCTKSSQFEGEGGAVQVE